MSTTLCQERPAVTVLFNDFAMLNELIASNQALGDYRIDGMAAGVSASDLTSDSGVAFTMCCGEQRYTCFGIAAPAPGLDEMIQRTRADNAQFAPLQQTQAHLLCQPEADNSADGLTQTLQLFGFAAALAAHQAAGVIHTSAWQCFRCDQLTGLLAGMGDDQDADAWAMALINVIPLFAEGCTYYVTRGAQVLGSRNVCLFDSDNRLANNGQERNALIYSLLSYLRGGAQIKVGETMSLADHDLKAEPVDETYAGYIKADDDDDILQVRLGAEADGDGPATGSFGLCCAFLLVSASDGSIDKKEFAVFCDCLGSYAKHPKLGAIAADTLAVTGNIEVLIEAGPQGWAGALHKDSSRLRAQDPALHRAYRAAVVKICTKVASAAGGFLGFGNKISKQEQAALDLISEILDA